MVFSLGARWCARQVNAIRPGLMHQPVALSPFRAELRDTLRLAAPLVLANLLQMAVYAVDVIFVARLGQEALAAASLATSLFGLIGWTFSALTGAVAPLIAAELGRARHAVREVRRSIRMALWLALVTGLAGMGLCLTVGPLMRATGQDPVVADMAERFILVLAFSLVPLLIKEGREVGIAAVHLPRDPRLRRLGAGRYGHNGYWDYRIPRGRKERRRDHDLRKPNDLWGRGPSDDADRHHDPNCRRCSRVQI